MKNQTTMLPEVFQTLLNKTLAETEANALIGLYNTRQQTMKVIPIWGCEEPDGLPEMLVNHLIIFADAMGDDSSIGAFAFTPME